MLRVAIQIKELISSNVTSVIEAASDPVKMLGRLQREIEESIISLEGERGRALQKISRFEAELGQTKARESDWSDKAKTAMNHEREDLARQALMAREECTAALVRIKDDIKSAKSDLGEIDQAIADLEVKRDETREEARQHSLADRTTKKASARNVETSKAEAQKGRISELERRTEFATQSHAEKRAQLSIDDEIDAMRRATKVEEELAALKGGTAQKAAARKGRAKKAS